MSVSVHNKLHDLATAPTIAPSSVYANACREGAVSIRKLRAALVLIADNPDHDGESRRIARETLYHT